MNTSPEHEAVQAVEVPGKDPEGTFEAAYFKLLEDLLTLVSQVPSELVQEELMDLLASNNIQRPVPPACDCGHEFSIDPHEYHLDTCAWRKFKLMP